MTTLAYHSHCLSTNHNPELWFVICTGVVLACTHHSFYGFSVQCMVAWWLPHWVVWNMGVQASAGDIVMCSWARYFTHTVLFPRRGSRGGEMGEFSPPFFWAPLFFLIPQILKWYLISLTLLQKFTPHFKILDPPLLPTSKMSKWILENLMLGETLQWTSIPPNNFF